MPTILAVNHEVADYDTWKRAFDDFDKAERGALFHRVNRSVENPNSITVVHGFESPAAAQAFVADPDLADAMKKAGVTGAPRVEIYDEVEAAVY